MLRILLRPGVHTKTNIEIMLIFTALQKVLVPLMLDMNISANSNIKSSANAHMNHIAHTEKVVSTCYLIVASMMPLFILV